MLHIFIILLGQAESVLVGEDSPQKVRVQLLKATGEDDNVVVRLSGSDGKGDIQLTEEGITGGRFDLKTKAFEVFDDQGQRVTVRLLSNGQALCAPPEFDKYLGPAFVVIQEGGSSSELYVHALNSQAHAARYQADCGNDGAYQTSDVVKVPASLANHPDFLRVAEELVKATLTLENRSTEE